MSDNVKRQMPTSIFDCNSSRGRPGLKRLLITGAAGQLGRVMRARLSGLADTIRLLIAQVLERQLTARNSFNAIWPTLKP